MSKSGVGDEVLVARHLDEALEDSEQISTTGRIARKAAADFVCSSGAKKTFTLDVLDPRSRDVRAFGSMVRVDLVPPLQPVQRLLEVDLNREFSNFSPQARTLVRVTIEQIAKDFGVHPMTLQKWLSRAEIDDGAKPGQSHTEAVELWEARKRIWLLEQEVEVLSRAAAYLSQANLPPKGSTRSSSELAVDGIPIAVACRVLKLANPTTDGWLTLSLTLSEARPIERTRSSMLTTMTRNSATGSSWTRLVMPVSRWQTARRGGSVETTAGGARSGRRRVAKAADPAGRSTMTGSNVTSPRMPPISSGSATSPSTRPPKASSTSARSRTRAPTGSWGIRSVTDQ